MAFFDFIKGSSMGAIPPKPPPMPGRFPPMPPVKNPNNVAQSPPQTFAQRALIKEFDMPSGKVFVLNSFIDVNAYMFSECVEGEDYQFIDEKFYVNAETYMRLILYFENRQ